jgi:hypothetical protein
MLSFNNRCCLFVQERSFRRDALKSFIQKVAKIDDGESGASFWARFFGVGGARASKDGTFCVLLCAASFFHRLSRVLHSTLMDNLIVINSSFIVLLKYSYTLIFYACFFLPVTRTCTRVDRDSTDEPVEKVVMREPTPLSAKVEKKTTKGAGGSWKTL